MIVNCAIVDDEPLALDLLESYIRKTPFLNLVGRYSSAIQAMRELPNQSVDLLFLDIQMPDLSGVDFSKMLPSDIRVIFTTAFSEYAADSYRVNALDYLLKPISYAVFLEASNKALNWFEMSRKSAEQTSNPAESDIIFIKQAIISKIFNSVLAFVNSSLISDNNCLFSSDVFSEAIASFIFSIICFICFIVLIL